MRTAPILVAWSLIVIAQCGPVAAEDVTGLLKRLDLKGYASRTTPPHFSGRTVEAREISLADLSGQVLLLNFWASWCLECHLEMPALEGLHRDFASRGLAVVGVNAREAPGDVRRYASERGLTFVLDIAPKGIFPTMFATPFFTERGGLASYGAFDADLGRQAARLVDRILKGAKPADLPVEQPTRFELVINLKTAKALGLTLPTSLLQRADRLIQ